MIRKPSLTMQQAVHDHRLCMAVVLSVAVAMMAGYTIGIYEAGKSYGAIAALRKKELENEELGGRG